MHHLTCGIIFYSVNRIVFTLLNHPTLYILPHHSPCLLSHNLSLPQPFTPDVKPNCSTNPFLKFFDSIWIAFTDFGLETDLLGTGVSLVSLIFVFGYVT